LYYLVQNEGRVALSLPQRFKNTKVHLLWEREQKNPSSPKPMPLTPILLEKMGNNIPNPISSQFYFRKK
jgi:hypothetical protein